VRCPDGRREEQIAATSVYDVKDSAVKSARLSAKDIYYPGTPQGFTATHQGQVTPTCSPSSRHDTHGMKVQPSLHAAYVVDMEWRPQWSRLGHV
jgi:hypothetical protein